jgi:hypothetical protein
MFPCIGVGEERSSVMRLQARVAMVAGLAALLAPLAVAVSGSPGSAVGSAFYQQSTQLPLPADPGATPGRILSMSCGAAGSCVAVGWYQVGSELKGVIETLSGGHWTATAGPAPAGATGATTLGGVSCSGAGACAAWGEYATGPSSSAYMAVVLSGGTWKAVAIGPPSGGTFPSGGFGNDGPITGVGCFGPDSCVLVGNYFTGGSPSYARGWVSVYSSNAWQPALMVVVPPDSTGQASSLTGVSCGAGVCQGVGEYVSSAGFQSLEVSINSGGSMNAPFAGALPTGATQADGGLTGISCDSGGACAAVGQYRTTGGSNSEAYVVPVGGTAFQPQQPLTPTAESTTLFPATTLRAVSCAGGGCLVAGDYYDTSSTVHPLLDRFANGTWHADTPPSGAYPDAVACGAPAFCVGIDQGTPSLGADVYASSTWASAPVALPAGASSGAVAEYNGPTTACDATTSCWVLGNYDSSWFADDITTTPPVTSPPTITLTGPTAPFALGSTTKVSWTASATAGLAGFQVRTRKASWNGGFGGWTVSWPSVAASARSLTVGGLAQGTDHCYEARAGDTLGHWSSWTAERCTARPLDDRAVGAGAHWARVRGSAFWNGTATVTTTHGVAMSRPSAQLDRISLVATRCPSCGKVRVYVGSSLIGTVNLAASRTTHRVVFTLPAFALRSGTVRLVVISAGRSVQIDGLGISRT